VLTVHRAARADVLVAALAGVLADAPADPFAHEVVSVPSRGVERWVTQSLSARLGARDGHGDGVCANVRFPFPGSVIGAALAQAAEVDPHEDVWSPERLVWPLISVVDDNLAEPWLAALAQHLGQGQDGADRGHRRFSSLRHVADLFDRYAIHRPAMLRAWCKGSDVDELGAPLPRDLLWQPALWRALCARVAVPSPAERLPTACARIATDPDLLDLPERLALFGLTRLPAAYVEVLRAIAAHRDVHLFLLHPSPTLWERVAAEPLPDVPPRRADDNTRALVRNPLLASWGRDAREMQITLARGADREVAHRVSAEPDTLLGRLQADIRSDVAPPGQPFTGHDARMTLRDDDRSLQVHACHGRARQVEVVRDAVLHLLAGDPTLEPRDVLVMCPDVEDFAPLVHATFAGVDDDQDAADRPPDLRVRLADRSIRQTNALLGTVAALLDLVPSRVAVSQVLDLLGRPPVRRRFGLDDDDLSTIGDWIRESGVRWGLDARGREPFLLGDLHANTWRFGLDRILTGVAVADDGRGTLVDGVLPLDDISSQSIELVGRLAEFLARLARCTSDLAGPRPVAGWTAAIAEAVDLVCDVRQADAWQVVEFTRVLDDVAEHAAGADETPMSLSEIRGLLADRLRGRPTRANFRTGDLTVCTLVPMRSVPHRVICVMGLDDGSFPRRGAGDGDDVLARDPRVGDRDVRGEDRQLLLDALHAATEHLVITFSGHHERTNAELPPAVPVQELLDVIDRTAVRADGTPASGRVRVDHPLHAFDPRNFTPGRLGVAGPWGFDPAAHRGALASQGERVDRVPLVPAPLAPRPGHGGGDIDLRELTDFVKEPVTAFLRRRLGVYLAGGIARDCDAIPVELDPLERWQVGDRLLAARMRGFDADACRAMEAARGHVPPGALAAGVLDPVLAIVECLLLAHPCLLGDPPRRSVQIEVALAGGRRLVGTVAGVCGNVLAGVGYSRLKPSRRLESWGRLLALTAWEPDTLWSSVTVGRAVDGQKGGEATAAHVAPLPGATPSDRRAAALAHLQTIVELFDEGSLEPLPIFDKTSHALATEDDPKKAAPLWEGDWFPECAEPENVLVLGGEVSFDAIADARTERLAHRLWGGLRAHERLEPG
jgi:exodeoxyribonuclease V gamma subunit